MGEPQSNTALYPQFMEPNPAVIAHLRFRRALQHALDRNPLNDLDADPPGVRDGRWQKE